ncbi:MAG: hypothetical protein WCM93_15125, partial [Bacteroidota bacterium]
YDNLYYEVCNEPYFGDTIALIAWEKKMIDVIIDAEKGFQNKHLISQNVSNGYRLVDNPHPEISVFNFHYAKPPKTVPMNYHLNKVIGDNETGFNGIDDATYRTEAWDFLLAGGALFNNLDYSFVPGAEDGTYTVKKGQPGGGGKTFRRQLSILSDFMRSLDYIHMKPDTSFLKILKPENCRFQALVKKNDTYAVYFNNYTADTKQTSYQSIAAIAEIEADLPQNSYKVTWFDTKSKTLETMQLDKHPGGKVRLASPTFLGDIALKITALK